MTAPHLADHLACTLLGLACMACPSETLIVAAGPSESTDESDSESDLGDGDGDGEGDGDGDGSSSGDGDGDGDGEPEVTYVIDTETGDTNRLHIRRADPSSDSCATLSMIEGEATLGFEDVVTHPRWGVEQLRVTPGVDCAPGPTLANGTIGIGVIEFIDEPSMSPFPCALHIDATFMLDSAEQLGFRATRLIIPDAC